MTGRGVAVAILLGLILAVAILGLLMSNRGAIVQLRCDVSSVCPSPTASE